MIATRRSSKGILSGLIALQLGACGGGGGGSGGGGTEPISTPPPPAFSESTPPQVLSVSPEPSDESVATRTIVKATFSEAIEAASLSGFKVNGRDAIEGQVTFDLSSNTAVFTPDRALPMLSSIDVTIDKTLKDTSNNALAANYAWSFYTGDGQWRTERTFASATGDYAFSPFISKATNNSAMIGWLSVSSALDYRLYSSTYTEAAGWSEPSAIGNDTTTDIFGSTIAADSQGNALAAWNQVSDGRGRVFGARYSNGQWSAVEALDSDAAIAAHSPQLSSADNGSGIAAWSQEDSGSSNLNIYVSMFSVNGGWSEPEAISSPGTNSMSAALAMTPAGDALVSWREALAPGLGEIQARTFSTGAGWSSQTTVSVPGGNAVFPRTALNAQGAGGITWQNIDNDRRDIWAARYQPGIGFSEQTRIETLDDGSAYGHRIAVDATGNMLVVWVQSDGTADSIWSNRYTIGAGWGNPRLLEVSSTAISSFPQVAFDDTGNASVLWSQASNGIRNIMMARYLIDSGWQSAEAVDDEAFRHADEGVLTFTEEGRAIGAWMVDDGTTGSIQGTVFE